MVLADMRESPFQALKRGPFYSTAYGTSKLVPFPILARTKVLSVQGSIPTSGKRGQKWGTLGSLPRPAEDLSESPTRVRVTPRR